MNAPRNDNHIKFSRLPDVSSMYLNYVTAGSNNKKQVYT